MRVRVPLGVLFVVLSLALGFWLAESKQERVDVEITTSTDAGVTHRMSVSQVTTPPSFPCDGGPGTLTDPNNCGACGTLCGTYSVDYTPGHGGVVNFVQGTCTAGICSPYRVNTATLNCWGLQNGSVIQQVQGGTPTCLSILNSSQNCGGLGYICEQAPCVNGDCKGVLLKPQAFAIAPKNSTVTGVDAGVAFVVSGGQAPYTCTLEVDTSGAHINPATCAYTTARFDAGADGGYRTDTVEAFDQVGNQTATNVTVHIPAPAPLVLSPANPTVTGFDASEPFTVSGGVAPYTCSITINNSGAHVNASTCFYVAGPFDGGADGGSRVDTVKALDLLGDMTTTTVTARLLGLSLSPATQTIHEADAGSRVIDFVVTGGLPPYVCAFVTNNTSGTINASTCVYVAGPVGQFATLMDTVKVTDNAGHIRQSIVTVMQ